MQEAAPGIESRGGTAGAKEQAGSHLGLFGKGLVLNCTVAETTGLLPPFHIRRETPTYEQTQQGQLVKYILLSVGSKRALRQGPADTAVHRRLPPRAAAGAPHPPGWRVQNQLWWQPGYKLCLGSVCGFLFPLGARTDAWELYPSCSHWASRGTVSCALACS